MFAAIFSTDIDLKYVYSSPESILWADHLVGVAKLYFSRFSPEMSHNAMYAEIDWFCVDGSPTDKSYFSILPGNVAAAMYQYLPDSIEVDDPEWVVRKSANDQVIVLSNISSGDFIAFIG